VQQPKGNKKADDEAYCDEDGPLSAEESNNPCTKRHGKGTGCPSNVGFGAETTEEKVRTATTTNPITHRENESSASITLGRSISANLAGQEAVWSARPLAQERTPGWRVGSSQSRTRNRDTLLHSRDRGGV
jgi:hypothetical protein